NLNSSKPYVLLKYRPTDDKGAPQDWAFKVYHVVAEEGPFQFEMAGKAATKIAPPYPLDRLLPACAKSTAQSETSSLFWDYRSAPPSADYASTMSSWIGWWARAQGTSNPGKITAQFYYPL